MQPSGGEVMQTAVDSIVSPSAIAYDAMKHFRDSTIDYVRGKLRAALGDEYFEKQVKPLWSAGKWKRDIENADAVRELGLITTQYVDELDLLDARAFKRLFEHLFSHIKPSTTQKEALLRVLEDIEQIRNPIGHPGSNDLSKIDALRAVDLFARAARLIHGEGSACLEKLEALQNRLLESDFPIATNNTVDKWLPPRHEVVVDFIGRNFELEILSNWLKSEYPIWVLEGDGGKGKSSLAYALVDQITSPENGAFDKVVWMTAKKRRFLEGRTISIRPDFCDIDSAFNVLLQAYGVVAEQKLSVDKKRAFVMSMLIDRPALIVLDDIDSLEGRNDDVVFFFTQQILRRSNCKILMTSRRHLLGFGGFTTIVHGFSIEETRDYLSGIKQNVFHDRPKIFNAHEIDLLHAASDGSPLYLEDLIRMIRVLGISVSEAVAAWRGRSGDGVREYALRREFDMLKHSARKALLAACVSSSPITLNEIKAACNLSFEEAEQAVSDLQRAYLLSQPAMGLLSPQFEVNNNLKLLVRSVFAGSEDLHDISAALKQVRAPASKPHKSSIRVQRAISDSTALAHAKNYKQAEKILKSLLEEFRTESALFSQLGWLYSLWGPEYRTEALNHLEKAIALKYRARETYLLACNLYAGMNDAASAANVLNVGLEIFPDDAEFLYLRAVHVLTATISAVRLSGVAASEPEIQTARRASNDALRLAAVNGPLAGKQRELLTERNQFDRFIDQEKSKMASLAVAERSAIENLPRRAYRGR